MESFDAVVALVLVAAITPGPNNLVVMRAATRRGVRGVLPELSGIVLGSVALLAVSVVLGGTIFALAPGARTALALLGCGYLAWLGMRLVGATVRHPRRTHRPEPGRDPDDEAPTALPAGLAGLVAFQFLNPKAWVLALTAAAAFPAAGRVSAFVRLAPVFALIPAACLLLWSAAGSLLTSALRRASVRAWFDRALGLVLIASAALLLLEA